MNFLQTIGFKKIPLVAFLPNGFSLFNAKVHFSLRIINAHRKYTLGFRNIPCDENR